MKTLTLKKHCDDALKLKDHTRKETAPSMINNYQTLGSHSGSLSSMMGFGFRMYIVVIQLKSS